MTKKPALIHVGMPRAGSTLLQNHFRQSTMFASERFSFNGTESPPKIIKKTGKLLNIPVDHNATHRAFISQFSSYFYDQSKALRSIHEIQELPANRHGLVNVISNEGLCRNLNINYQETLKRLKDAFLNTKCLFVVRSPISWSISVYKRLMVNVLIDNKSESIIPPYASKDIPSFLEYCRAFPQFRFGDCGLRQGKIAKELKLIFAENLYIIPFEQMISPLCEILFQYGEHVEKLNTGKIINPSHSWDRALAAREALLLSTNVKKSRKNFHSLINSGKRLASSNIHLEMISNLVHFCNHDDKLLEDLTLLQGLCDHDLTKLGYYSHARPNCDEITINLPFQQDL